MFIIIIFRLIMFSEATAENFMFLNPTPSHFHICLSRETKVPETRVETPPFLSASYPPVCLPFWITKLTPNNKINCLLLPLTTGWAPWVSFHVCDPCDAPLDCAVCWCRGYVTLAGILLLLCARPPATTGDSMLCGFFVLLALWVHLIGVSFSILLWCWLT